MVSYYNTLPYSQKHSATNLAYPAGQPWNYYTPPNHQFLSEMDSSHAHHQMYYNHMFHSTAAPTAPEWHSPSSSADNFAQNAPTAHQLMQHQHHHHANNNGLANNLSGSNSTTSSISAGSTSSGPASGNTQLNETASSIGEQQQQQQQQHQQQQHIAEGLPSPPITVSGSEISSPGAPASSSSPHHISHHMHSNNSPSTNNNNNSSAHNHNRSSPVKPQYYDWMKKPSYPAQPTPGKTRTKDKYRVVYTDFQRLELEKEYCTSRYITIRRKTELAQTLALSERQVKIWFQNRRAKERKQSKKGSDSSSVGMGGGMQHNDYSNLLDGKTKLEPGLHLQHTLHSMGPMAAMGMPAMRLHPLAHSHSLAVSAAAAHSHQLQQHHNAQMQQAAAAAGVGALSM